MIQSLQLGPGTEGGQGIQRISRLPLLIAFAILLLALALLVFGLSSRGFIFGQTDDGNGLERLPATSFADKLKQGVSNGIIADEQGTLRLVQPIADNAVREAEKPPSPILDERKPETPSNDDWRARLKREEEEQIAREGSRLRLARIQAESTARDAPLKIDISSIGPPAMTESVASTSSSQGMNGQISPIMQAALAAGNSDQNGQDNKQAFLETGAKRSDRLGHQVVASQSRYELKRGSIIPATLITGINSDLPGYITAQVSQNVYDSSTGYKLLIPQGSRLLGRYDSKVSFGQDRVLVAWSHLILPNGESLQIDAMAGTDQAGYGGFADQVDNHYLRTFGSAALIALIGTGIDLAIPKTRPIYGAETASDVARRNFAESLGRVAEQSVTRGLSIQPTIEIRPGYQFNILVDKDITFPSAYDRS